MVDLSIIIPVYNLEDYIEKCLKAILSNNNKLKIEIIIIDDGSIDNSSSICWDFAQKYKVIKYFKIKNSGVSVARNFGINHINGKYVMFVDGDDRISNDTFDILSKYIFKDYDLFVFNYFVEDSSINIYKKIAKEKVVNSNVAIKNFLSGKYIGVNVFDKIFRADIVKKLQFNSNIKIGEDMLFVYQYLCKTKKIYYVNSAFYFYYKRSNSAMNSNFNSKFFDILYVSDLINSDLKNNKNLINYAKGLEIYNKYKTVERFLKGNSPSDYSKKIEDICIDIKKYSLFIAFKYMCLKRFIGLFIFKISKKIYLKICKRKKI